MNESINDEAVCRTAPATPGLLNIVIVPKRHSALPKLKPGLREVPNPGSSIGDW